VKKQVGMSDEELKVKVGEAMAKNPASLTELGRLLGWKKICGRQTKRIRLVCPGVEEVLKQNVAGKPVVAVKPVVAEPVVAAKPVAVTKPVAAAKAKSVAEKPVKVAGNHVAGNPYRDGSNYAVVFDCLATMGKDKPVSRKELVAEVCKVTGKDATHVGYDFSVVLSPSEQGKAHRNAQKYAQVYYVNRLEGGLVQVHMR